MDVSLIQVPYMMGDERQGKGPLRLVQAGAEKLVTAKGVAVAVERVDRGEPFRDSGNAALVVGKRLAATVQRVVEAGRLPFAFAGGCDASAGVVSGFDHRGCGVVWFDAHGDFNTPETTVSGYLAGMSMAVITGHCFRGYWAQMGDSTPVRESATLMLSLRDLDPAEEERLYRSDIQVVKWRDGKPQSDVRIAIEGLAGRVQEVYLHIDNGEDLKTIQELLRHATFKVTADTYTQAVTPVKREAHAKIAKLILADVPAAKPVTPTIQ